MGSLLECWFSVLIPCFQCFTDCGCRGFFLDVMDFFSEGEESELIEVFCRLWLSLKFFFLDVVDFFRGRIGRRRLGFLGYVLWKLSVK